jgi:hypothetical protein
MQMLRALEAKSDDADLQVSYDHTAAHDVT